MEGLPADVCSAIEQVALPSGLVSPQRGLDVNAGRGQSAGEEPLTEGRATAFIGLPPSMLLDQSLGTEYNQPPDVRYLADCAHL
ncbi:MAG TPA: hypothetical protein VII53_08595 [Solirubrobacteraceae bacterium]